MIGIISRSCSIRARMSDPTTGWDVMSSSCAAGATRVPDDERPVEALTPREHDVLVLLADGVGNREIAARLAISEHTVKFHVTKLLRRYRVRRRSELAGIAHEMFLTG